MHSPDPREMFASGFSDLISIAPPNGQLVPSSKISGQQLGKVPARKLPNGLYVGYGWRKEQHTADDVERWVQEGSNIGLRSDHWPMVDLDITDETLADFVEKAAVKMLGPAPVRVGKAPKRLLLYRTSVPFRRMRLWFKKDGHQHLIEILGQGQQAVVHGIHPSTLAPYRWNSDTLNANDLTPITREHATSFLDYLAEQLPLNEVAEVEREGDGRPETHGPAADQEDLRAPSEDELRKAVALIPNSNELFPARDDYITMGYAIKAAAGEEADALSLFTEWAAKFEGNSRFPNGNDPEVVIADFRRMRGPYRVGWAWIASLARDHGYDQVATEFSAVDTGEVLSDGERIAAISGDPTRAFFLEMSELPDDQLLHRWNALQIAELIGDSLAPMFRKKVLPKALRLDRFASELTRFTVLLESEVENELRASNLSPGERSLLFRSAYVLLAPLGSLVAGLSSSPGDPLPPNDESRDDLVEGWIPARGLAALVGPPGHGKTFVALELAARVARVPDLDPLTQSPISELFAHRRVQHGSAIYLASEDASGLRRRAGKWVMRHENAQHLHLFGRVPALTDPARAIRFVLDAIERVRTPHPPPLRLIVVDVARAAIQGDENSSEIVGAAMATAHLLARMTGAAVLLVHHSPKTNPTEARGSSAFLGALDFQASIEGQNGLFSLTVTKNKQGAAGDRFAWQLDDEVLRPVSSQHQPPEGDAGRIANTAARIVRDLANGKGGVARADLVAKLRAEHPELLGQGVAWSTSQTRVTQALKKACQRGLLQRIGNGRKQTYRPGSADTIDGVPLTPNVGSAV